MYGFVGQNCQFAITEFIEGLSNPGIESSAVKHVRTIVGKKHLQTRLNIVFCGFGIECATNQHQRSITDETSDLFFRQNRQVESSANVVDGCGQVFLRINQRTVEVKDQNRTHRVII